MTSSTSSNIISTAIENNSFEVADRKEQKQNGKITIDTGPRTRSFELLVYQADNLQNHSNQICQNWLKAHETTSLEHKDVRQYTRIVILLQDIVELVEKIGITIQHAWLQKQEISETVKAIVSNSLDIKPEQIAFTANLVKDFGLDSLEWQELLITMEETFVIKLSYETVRKLVTLQQLVDYIVSTVQNKN